MSWLAIAVTYLRFREGMRVQGFDRSTLPYKSVFAYWGAWYAIVMIVLISFFSAWTVFLRDSWDTAIFVTSESSYLLVPSPNASSLPPSFIAELLPSRAPSPLSRLSSFGHLSRPLRRKEGHLENDMAKGSSRFLSPPLLAFWARADLFTFLYTGCRA